MLSAMSRADPLFHYDGHCVGHYHAVDRNACFVAVMRNHKLTPPYDRSTRFPEIHFVPASHEPLLQWWNGGQVNDRGVFVYHAGNSDGKGYRIVSDMFPPATC